jgi:NAD(P)-dependent dehydrogenase (short-subunit alcohol dehydrogenase family)
MVEGWNRVIETNLTAAFVCAQAAFKIMKGQDRRNGRIINNSSISASRACCQLMICLPTAPFSAARTR